MPTSASHFTRIPGWWSWKFITYQVILIIVGRYFAIFFCFYLMKICCRTKTISNMERVFIGWGGMIRGAIAFALVMRIP